MLGSRRKEGRKGGGKGEKKKRAPPAPAESADARSWCIDGNIVKRRIKRRGESQIQKHKLSPTADRKWGISRRGRGKRGGKWKGKRF